MDFKSDLFSVIVCPPKAKYCDFPDNTHIIVGGIHESFPHWLLLYTLLQSVHHLLQTPLCLFWGSVMLQFLLTWPLCRPGWSLWRDRTASRWVWLNFTLMCLQFLRGNQATIDSLSIQFYTFHSTYWNVQVNLCCHSSGLIFYTVLKHGREITKGL